MSWRRGLCLCLLCLAAPLAADTLRVAVASNFVPVARELARGFERMSGHRVVLAPGSTGKHAAQILHGAPFDVFLAADRARPRRLEQAGVALPGTRFTYARGRLALWSPRPDLAARGEAALRRLGNNRLAIANPRLAPYGRAARQALRRLGLWRALQPALVRGENIAQAFQFVNSGNADLGLVAWSQLKAPGVRGRGSHWLLPAALYDPIEQQAVQLRRGEAAAAFLRYLRSPAARALIRQAGYEVDDAG